MLSGLLGNMFFFLTEAQIVYPDGTTQPVDLSDGLDLSEIAQPAQTSNWPSPVIIGLCVALGLICIGLMVVILLQKKRASGIGAAIAGSGETYFSKNKGKTFEGTLENYTKWGGVAFLVIALLINIFM